VGTQSLKAGKKKKKPSLGATLAPYNPNKVWLSPLIILGGNRTYIGATAYRKARFLSCFLLIRLPLAIF